MCSYRLSSSLVTTMVWGVLRVPHLLTEPLGFPRACQDYNLLLLFILLMCSGFKYSRRSGMRPCRLTFADRQRFRLPKCSIPLLQHHDRLSLCLAQAAPITCCLLLTKVLCNAAAFSVLHISSNYGSRLFCLLPGCDVTQRHADFK
jgi:hypothetical protein